MRYLIVDLNNLVSRAVHVVRAPTTEEWLARTMTIVFHSIRKNFAKFVVDHLVVCIDSWSWRETLYETYKVNRKLDTTSMTAANQRKIDAKKVSHTVIDLLEEFYRDETNVTVLRERGVEADDFIARWTQVHGGEDLQHVIFSNDSDFKQLVRIGVDLFDPRNTGSGSSPVPSLLYTADAGILYQDEEPCEWKTLVNRFGETWKVQTNDTGDPVKFDPSWELFLKCMRGDPRDNIRPAYPKVSEVRLRAAFADRGGLEWNNLINSTWGKPGTEQSVRELYDLNVKLIDLSAQPADIISMMDKTIETEIDREPKQMVDSYFEAFCRRHKVGKLLDHRQAIVRTLSSPYRLS